MSSHEYDLITIGAGSGGVAASRYAAAKGARVAICEADRVGGTCVIRGCVPKKIFMYAAQFSDAFTDAAGYGWQLTEPCFDLARLTAAKDAEIARIEAVYRKMLAESGVRFIAGRAAVQDAHSILINGERLSAERLLIATGGAPSRPDIPGIELAATSNEMLDLTATPARLLVLGSGYIAVEFAGIFRGFGSAVTLAYRADAPLRGFDPDVRRRLGAAMRERGIVQQTGFQVARIERVGEEFACHGVDGRVLHADLVLNALGRAPNTANLGLEQAGVVLQPTGAVRVDQWSRSNVPSIFAVGDVTDRVNLTPVAIAEGRAVAETLFNDNPIRMDHANVASAVFSQPPIGAVGLTEEQARRQYGEVDIYLARFKPMKNTLSGREERTLMKLVVDARSDRVLGCHMLGPDAPEILQGLAIAVKCGVSKRMFDETIGIHPSAAEEFVTMREKLVRPRMAAE